MNVKKIAIVLGLILGLAGQVVEARGGVGFHGHGDWGDHPGHGYGYGYRRRPLIGVGVGVGPRYSNTETVYVDENEPVVLERDYYYNDEYVTPGEAAAGVVDTATDVAEDTVDAAGNTVSGILSNI